MTELKKLKQQIFEKWREKAHHQPYTLILSLEDYNLLFSTPTNNPDWYTLINDKTFLGMKVLRNLSFVKGEILIQ